VTIVIEKAKPQDGNEIAEIHVSARRTGMPYLNEPFTDEEMRDFVSGKVESTCDSFWAARCGEDIVGYSFGENMESFCRGFEGVYRFLGMHGPFHADVEFDGLPNTPAVSLPSVYKVYSLLEVVMPSIELIRRLPRN
jgi:hypothetical protein